MCWQCDHPGATASDYCEHLVEEIARYGWIVQGVERDRIHPPWAYTVGLTEADLPELVVTGLPSWRAAALLNGVAEHTVHAEPPVPGTQVQLVDGPLIEVVRIPVPDAHLMVAVGLYGPDIRALQLVHADDRGHWPWDSYFRGIRGGQPVLGPREPEARRTRIG
ncbi:MAG TPA: DUF4262 domain-containing protein [Streptosporangiaceae bacterium]|nr:DUF4262 domain-containing protein [Streptosporangiaceae bacterium]